MFSDSGGLLSVLSKTPDKFHRASMIVRQQGWSNLLKKIGSKFQRKTYVSKTSFYPRSMILDCMNYFKGDLTDMSMNYKTDKGLSKHLFTYIYEHFLREMRNEKIRLLEIGVRGGHSLKLWQSYFPRAEIFGIDKHDSSRFNSNRIKTFVANQESRTELKRQIDLMGDKPFDLILDDGGHSMKQQQTSLGFLFPYLKNGGYYIIEDLHTSRPERIARYSEGASDAPTLDMVSNFVKERKLHMTYLSPEESQYVEENIDFLNLFSRHNSLNSTTLIIRKKT